MTEAIISRQADSSVLPLCVQRPTSACSDCGKPVWRGTVRCKECHAALIGVPESKCACCGKTFKPRRKTENKYCSRECAFADVDAWLSRRPPPSNIGNFKKFPVTPVGPYRQVHFNFCTTCCSSFTARKKASTCDKCDQALTQLRKDELRAVVQCKCCGNTFKRSAEATTYCSKACSESVAASRKRIEKAKRKAVIRAVTIESVDPFKVFDRDGWICKLCGAKTPKTKRGTYDDDAPELDHIIPLAKGGEHSYRNTQCTCRKCNGNKSDKPMGQMLLIG